MMAKNHYKSMEDAMFVLDTKAHFHHFHIMQLANKRLNMYPREGCADVNSGFWQGVIDYVSLEQDDSEPGWMNVDYEFMGDVVCLN